MEDRIVNSFLLYWRDPNEIAFQEDFSPEEVEEVLEDNGIQSSSKKEREEYSRHLQSFQEPDYLADVDIDGSYVAENETPPLEDYVDMLSLEMTSKQITETINTIFNENIVSADEVNQYLKQKDNAERHGEGNFYITPETEDERIRLYGLKQVLNEYHENLEDHMEQAKEGRRMYERR